MYWHYFQVSFRAGYALRQRPTFFQFFSTTIPHLTPTLPSFYPVPYLPHFPNLTTLTFLCPTDPFHSALSLSHFVHILFILLLAFVYPRYYDFDFSLKFQPATVSLFVIPPSYRLQNLAFMGFFDICKLLKTHFGNIALFHIGQLVFPYLFLLFSISFRLIFQCFLHNL